MGGEGRGSVRPVKKTENGEEAGGISRKPPIKKAAVK